MTAANQVTGVGYTAQQSLRFVFAVCFCVFLAACSSDDLPPFHSSKKVNLTQSSYAAADMLLQQSKNIITPETPLQVGVLTNIKRPSETVALGQMIASQIGARFVQLGYNVTASSFNDGMAMPSGAFTTSPTTTAGRVDQALITGNYALAKKDILVNLRIIEQNTNRVLAAYDYSLPLNSNLKELTKTEADENSGNLFGL